VQGIPDVSPLTASIPDMHRRLSALLLAFCLLFSQQGALLHALKHDLHGASKVVDDGQDHPRGSVCRVCLAFAGAVGAVAAAFFVPPLLALQFHWAGARAFVRRTPDVPATRARGPPVVF
jgi:hypothetical protein